MSSDILVIDPNDDDEYAEEAALDGIEQAEEPPTRNWQLSIAAGLIVSLVLIGETVGGLIGLNNFEKLELGQGVATLTNCDDALTVTPKATAATINGEPGFKIEYIDIEGISDACLNKTFTLAIYKSVGLGSGQAAVIGKRMGTTDTNYVRFTLLSLPSAISGLDFKIYEGADILPDPPAAKNAANAALLVCGGENNAIANVDIDDFKWDGTDESKIPPGCPEDENGNIANVLSHIFGYVAFPGTVSETSQVTEFSLRSTGNAELRIGNKVVVSDRTNHAAANATGSFVHRPGNSYPFEIWYYKGTGVGELKLSWNRDSSGNVVSATTVPSNKFSFGNSVEGVVPSSEGVVDYTIEPRDQATNNRSVRVILGSVISSAGADRFTIETSDG